MPIKRRKDRAGLIASLKLREAAATAVQDASRTASGWHCTSPYSVFVRADGSEEIRPVPLLGEIHFVSGRWDALVASHELQHLQIHLERLWPATHRATIEQGSMDAEEFLCYRFGRLFATVFRWLWRTDSKTA